MIDWVYSTGYLDSSTRTKTKVGGGPISVPVLQSPVLSTVDLRYYQKSAAPSTNSSRSFR